MASDTTSGTIVSKLLTALYDYYVADRLMRSHTHAMLKAKADSGEETYHHDEMEKRLVQRNEAEQRLETMIDLEKEKERT
jgi:hypothetical protein